MLIYNNSNVACNVTFHWSASSDQNNLSVYNSLCWHQSVCISTQ